MDIDFVSLNEEGRAFDLGKPITMTLDEIPRVGELVLFEDTTDELGVLTERFRTETFEVVSVVHGVFVYKPGSHKLIFIKPSKRWF